MLVSLCLITALSVLIAFYVIIFLIRLFRIRNGSGTFVFSKHPTHDKWVPSKLYYSTSHLKLICLTWNFRTYSMVRTHMSLSSKRYVISDYQPQLASVGGKLIIFDILTTRENISIASGEDVFTACLSWLESSSERDKRDSQSPFV